MNDKSKKEGVTVKEIESYAKGYRYEIFFCALFVLATIFSMVFWGTTLAIFLTGVGGIVGVLLAEKIHQFAQKMAETIGSKEVAFQLIVGLLALVVAIFLAPVIFLILGVHGGKSMMRRIRKATGNGSKKSQ
ncbi:MAG: hypothetical protein JSS30_00270 [Verrucomicrobia bacterium]|nr:hypothetical protein [Verrucomicrobiota bacterium]